jgi:hypothetical protein
MEAGTSDTAGREEAEWRRREEELAEFLNARDHFLEEGRKEETEEHDMYAGEDASTKMMHLMHSDTLIVVMALIVMIIVGLLFRELMIRYHPPPPDIQMSTLAASSLPRTDRRGHFEGKYNLRTEFALPCRLTSRKSRKERMQGGLKQMAEHMHSVQRAMSGDLPEQHDSPKLVMRTYSNYGRAKPKEEEAVVPGSAQQTGAVGALQGKYPNVRTMSRENLRVQAFSNILAQEGVCLPSPQVTIEMSPVRGTS